MLHLGDIEEVLEGDEKWVTPGGGHPNIIKSLNKRKNVIKTGALVQVGNLGAH